MSLSISNMSIEAAEIVITVVSTESLTAAILIDTSGNSTDVLSLFLPTGTLNEYNAIIPGEFSDGIFTIDLTNGVDTEYKTVGTLFVGNACLLDKVLKENYDCLLLQQLEATKLALLSGEGDLARYIYAKVQIKCVSCTTQEVDYASMLEGISIWIVNDDFIVQ